MTTRTGELMTDLERAARRVVDCSGPSGNDLRFFTELGRAIADLRFVFDAESTAQSILDALDEAGRDMTLDEWEELLRVVASHVQSRLNWAEADRRRSDAEERRKR